MRLPALILVLSGLAHGAQAASFSQWARAAGTRARLFQLQRGTAEERVAAIRAAKSLRDALWMLARMPEAKRALGSELAVDIATNFADFPSVIRWAQLGLTSRKEYTHVKRRFRMNGDGRFVLQLADNYVDRVGSYYGAGYIDQGKEQDRVPIRIGWFWPNLRRAQDKIPALTIPAVAAAADNLVQRVREQPAAK
jgi:hypothetical protein